ncbi:MAG: hypothetical protein L3J39_01090 [Verrucomicrobiales bacterium]|nr:hypothetical protein [Verrucomicrobiales bacterium]
MASVEIGSVAVRARRLLSRSCGGRVVLGCCLLLVWQGLILAGLSAEVFQDPDFEVKVFDQDALSLQGDDRVMVVEALAALASNFPKNGLVDMDLREKALAIALRLDPLNASARASRAALLKGETPAKTKLFSELASISKVLSQRALMMKEKGEPEDAILVPLLLELAWVIYPSVGDGKAASYAAAVAAAAAGDRLPVWGKLVQLEKSPSKSSVRATKLLSRGRAYNKKVEQAVAAKVKQKQQQVLAAEKQAAKQQQQMMATAAKEQQQKKTKQAERALLAKTEMNVVAWTRSRVAGLQYHAAKMKLNIREVTEADAPLFENSKENTPDVMRMRFKYMPAPESVPSWMGSLFRVVQPRLEGVWPRGKVAEVDFVLMGNSAPLEPNQRLVGGMGAGTALALNSAVQGEALDPLSIIYVRIAADRSADDPPNGDLSEAIKVGKKGGFRLMVVASDAESKMLDWLALGELDRLIHPQIVAVDDFVELVQFTRADREAHLEEALQLFSEIEELTKKMTLAEAAKNEVVQQRLQAIIEQFPQHLSARMLLAYGKNSGEMKVSLQGSLEALKQVLQPLRQYYDSALDIDELDKEALEKLADQVDASLRDLRNQLDAEVKELINMSGDVAKAMVAFLRLKNKTTSTGLQKREGVEETLVYFNEEYRRLQDKVKIQKGVTSPR